MFEIYSRLGAQVTFWIAVAGFVISCASVVKGIVVNRRHLTIRVLGVCRYEAKMALILSASNGSRLPIAITDIRLAHNRLEYPCEPVSKSLIELRRAHGNQVYKTVEKTSTSLPENIPGLAGRQLYVLFEGLPDSFQMSSSSLILAICSNRGRLKKKKFSHVKVAPDLKTLFQL